MILTLFYMISKASVHLQVSDTGSLEPLVNWCNRDMIVNCEPFTFRFLNFASIPNQNVRGAKFSDCPMVQAGAKIEEPVIRTTPTPSGLTTPGNFTHFSVVEHNISIDYRHE